MSFEFIAKHVITDNEHYIWKLDEYRDGDKQVLFIHFSFKKFTSTAVKAAIKEWKLFRSIVTAPIFATRNDGDEDKWKHFVRFFGFQPTDLHLPTNIGEVRQLFIHRVCRDGRQH